MPLHADVEMLLRTWSRSDVKKAYECTPQQARERPTLRAGWGSDTPALEVGEIRDFEIAGAGGPMRARSYFPFRPKERMLPTLLLLHGGGFVLGNIDGQDAFARLLCVTCEAVILAFDYRLAPEARFPAAAEDAVAGMTWAAANVNQLGGDPRRISIAGLSAGANLAAVATWLAIRSGIDVQSNNLVYPTTDSCGKYASRQKFAEGFIITEKDIAWYEGHYAGRQSDTDPRRSPILIPEMSILPPTLVVTAEYDPFRDEGHAYAVKLAEAGVDVTLRCFRGTVHGFCSFGQDVRSAQHAMDEIAELISINIGRDRREVTENPKISVSPNS